MIANETVAGQQPDRRDRAPAQGRARLRVTVITPVNQPREGYVVYEDTRRAAAGRRLERTLEALREAGIPAAGLRRRDRPGRRHPRRARPARAAARRDRRLDAPAARRSGWLRRNVVERIERAAGGLPVEHVVVDLEREDGGEANVLVVANETVVGEPLLEKIRERAAQGPVCVPDRLAAERRRRASTPRPSAACAAR